MRAGSGRHAHAQGIHDDEASNELAGGSLLDEIVRDGARAMLAAALQAEVAAFADQLDEHGHRLVVRSGSHEEREVMTAAGVIPVWAPCVNDKRTDEATGERKRFASTILPAGARKSPKVAQVPLLYLHGLASGDFGPGAGSSSSARAPACPPRRSPGSPASGKTRPPRSTSGH